MLEGNLCECCYLDSLDEDEREMVESNEWYVETTDYEDTCEKCGEWSYIAIGLARTGYNAETDEYKNDDDYDEDYDEDYDDNYEDNYWDEDR